MAVWKTTANEPIRSPFPSIKIGPIDVTNRGGDPATPVPVRRSVNFPL